MRLRNHSLALVAAAMVGLFMQATGAAEPGSTRRERAEKPRTYPLVAPRFDKTAERIGLFEGMKDDTLHTKVVMHGPMGGFVIIGNKTDKPLTVDLPNAFIATPVLKQFGGGGLGGGGLGGGGLGGGGLGGGQGGGGGQQQGGGGFGGGGQGGGLGGGGLGGGGQGGGGQGFFSIPPEKGVKVPFVTVCLEHGKPDPTPSAKYTLVPVEERTNDPILMELITMVGTGRLAPQAAQAAVWNQTDKMSWQQLAHKYSYNSVGVKVPYFAQKDLVGAQMILATAIGRIKERGENPVADTTPVRENVR